MTCSGDPGPISQEGCQGVPLPKWTAPQDTGLERWGQCREACVLSQRAGIGDSIPGAQTPELGDCFRGHGELRAVLGKHMVLGSRIRAHRPGTGRAGAAGSASPHPPRLPGQSPPGPQGPTPCSSVTPLPDPMCLTGLSPQPAQARPCHPGPTVCRVQQWAGLPAPPNPRSMLPPSAPPPIFSTAGPTVLCCHSCPAASPHPWPEGPL